MRIATQLRTIVVGSAAVILVMVLALLWTFADIQATKANLALATSLKTAFFERTSFRDQFFLNHEESLVAKWDSNKGAVDALLAQEKERVRHPEDRRRLRIYAQAADETAIIFHRLVGLWRLSGSGEMSPDIRSEFEKRLSSQLLLKAGVVRDAVTDLERSCTRQVEAAYLHLALLVGFFTAGLALAFLVTSLRLGRFVQARLRPLHEGAQAVARGELNHRIEIHGSDELAELAQAFDAMTGQVQGFTQSLEAESAKRQEMARQLSSVLESAGDVIAMMNLEYRYILFNTSFQLEIQRIFGKTLVEGDSLLALLAHLPEDLAKALRDWDRALGGEDFTVVQQFGDTQWERHWYELHFSPVRGEDGAVIAAVHIVRNITERRRAEEQLKQVLREQEILLAHVNAGILLIIDRRQVWINDWMLRTFQYTREEMEGQTTRMLYACEEDYEQLGQEAYPALLSSGSFETTQRLFRKDGQARWIHYNGSLIDPSDLGQGTLWVLIDVTEQKAAELAMKESEERFRAMFERNQAAKIIVDPDTGAILEANAAAATFYGWTIPELCARSISDLNILSAAEIQQRMKEAAQQQVGRFEFRHRLADGQIRDVEVYSSPIPLASRTVLYSIIHDITERQEAEAALLQLNQTLELRVAEELARRLEHERALVHQSRLAAMGEMVGNIAHQWRQPLSALAMVLGGMKDAKRFNELTDDYFETSLQQGHELIQKMSATISDFLDFFRPDKVPTPFSLKHQAEEALRLVSSSFRHQQVAVEILGHEDVLALGHPNEFSQVLMNLLANAREAIASAGVEQGHIRIDVTREGRAARLRLSDNGGGISVTPIERIFEPYFTNKPMGTGLGLYMSRMIMEQSMQGRLEVKNLPGGAEFLLTLPLA